MMPIVQVTLATKEQMRGSDRLRGYAVVRFWIGRFEFAARDIKIVHTHERGLFLGMPSNRGGQVCPDCKRRLNDWDSSYCSGCGMLLPFADRTDGRDYCDSFHPMNQDSRNWLEEIVLTEYQRVVKEGLEARAAG
jgi:DNA-binding cell septation regulator SpoVG